MTEPPAHGPRAEDLSRFLETLTRVLAAVAVLALVFTAVNVTLFAVRTGIPWPIAILLDPLVALTLTAVLYADARLAAWGIRPPAWSTTLRWATGLIAALLNTWPSLWPDKHIGWPHHADIAGVVLHMVPPLMLIGLTETVAAYRRTLTDLTTAPRSGAALSTEPHPRSSEPEPSLAPAAEPATIQHRAPKLRTDPHPRIGGPASPISRSTTAPDRTALPAPAATHDPAPSHVIHPGSTPPHPPNRPIIHAPRATAGTNGGHVGPQPADSAPTTPPIGPGPHPSGENPADGDLFNRALALDAASRTSSGRGVSIRRLRTELHLGPKRARSLHERIQHHHTDHPAG